MAHGIQPVQVSVRVTLKYKPVEASYAIHGQILELVESAKYLGVTIDSKLNFNNQLTTSILLLRKRMAVELS